MENKLKLILEPSIAYNPVLLRDEISRELNLSQSDGFHYRLLRRSIDARSKNIKVNLEIEISSLPFGENKNFIDYKNADSKYAVHIIGAGPAGLFAALKFLESGIKPIVIERGKDVKSRRRDLAAINQLHIVNDESNYCFGEGGAGTYSDGKLYTRSGKRGSIEKILQVFVQHGAGEEILYEAHPHIGTNKLPKIIEAMRHTILEHGGEIHFNTRLSNIKIQDNKIVRIKTINTENHNEEELECENLILATGHSARDVYEILHQNKVEIEAKPFAMGVRIEHPQEIIDKMQYHCRSNEELKDKRAWLPAASYAWVEQVPQGGVYSFCMCPGGIIAPCATGPEQVVTNGWSPSKRNNPYANSGIVVEVNEGLWKKYNQHGPLAGMELQKHLEKNAWKAGGQKQSAPAQRLQDFINGKTSSSLPECSYQPGIVSYNLDAVLEDTIAKALRQGFKQVGMKMKSYLSSDAVIVAIESRTSTPVRIPRDKEKLHHVRVENLYPSGEGAGYAGGIVSAAIDGDRIAQQITACIKSDF